MTTEPVSQRAAAPCACCGQPNCYRHAHHNPTPPKQCWRVTELTDRGPGHFYRYQTTGTNLSFLPTSCDYRFSWSVPCLASSQYDLSAVGNPTCECGDCRAKRRGDAGQQ